MLVKAVVQRSYRPASKRVNFSETCRVVLIPERQEYVNAGIFLWWNQRDFSSFRENYLNSNPIEDAIEEMEEQQQPEAHSVLIVSDNADTRKFLAAKMSTLCRDPDVRFLTCSHNEVAALCDGDLSFSEVIIDGTESYYVDDILEHLDTGVSQSLVCMATARLVSILSPSTITIAMCVTDENSDMFPIVGACGANGSRLRQMAVVSLGSICRNDFRDVIGR
jgi:hypothetical protein